ncbi:hypothetical protein M5D96_008499 [Drosophila gunungcola]|uniref:Uncharacterized protein n=1 Tax=Drosophila gunungcola TaxID=103775 RepID=A0A9P9YKH3_9MUSC|nr:hypothetical protein M5D96_008499 [Drosophila gunungcola]
MSRRKQAKPRACLKLWGAPSSSTLDSQPPQPIPSQNPKLNPNRLQPSSLQALANPRGSTHLTVSDRERPKGGRGRDKVDEAATQQQSGRNKEAGIRRFKGNQEELELERQQRESAEGIGYHVQWLLLAHNVGYWLLGEKEDEESTGLLEPKEELLSGDEENEDNEDEDEEVVDEEAPEGGDRPQPEPNESQQQSWPPADEPAAPAAVAKEEGAEELQHPRDEVVASDAAAAVAAASASANANGHCKSSGKFDFNLHILLPLAKRYICV